MNLYLMRHGAADPEMSGGRYGLTPKGREEAASVAEELRHLNIPIHVLWHSTKTRAIETAQIVARAWENSFLLEPHAGLLPEDSAESFEECLEIWRLENPGKNMMIVSHLPFLPSLAFRLLGSASSVPAFPTAGCLGLERNGSGRWEMKFFLGREV